MPIAPVATQHVVDAVEYVGADHAYFVDHQQVEGPEQVDLFAAEPTRFLLSRSGHDGAKRQLKQRVNRDAPRVNGRHTRGCHHGKPLGVRLLNLVQKRGFAGSGFARQKNVPVGVQDKVGGEVEFFVDGGGHQYGGLRARQS